MYANSVDPDQMPHSVALRILQCSATSYLGLQVWANSADADQTPRGAIWSGFTVFAIPSASFALLLGNAILLKF